MDILDNELIRKYFTPQYKAFYPCEDKTSKMDAEAWDRCALARNVLTAMQEPIRDGTRMLQLFNDKWTENTALEGFYAEPWHPMLLVLPSRFQEAGKKECCYEYFSGSCPTCGMTHLCRKPQPPPEPSYGCFEAEKHKYCHICEPVDAVEAKIAWFKDQLRQELKMAYDNGVAGIKFGVMPAQWERAMRELVDLARE